MAFFPKSPIKGQSSWKWIFHIHHISMCLMYCIFLLCIFLNIYVLLSRADTIYYLRIYHVIVGLLMISTSVVMIEFMCRTRKLPKLDAPHEMPRPAMIGAIALTVGIVVGYAYFMIFNFSMGNCDKLVDQLYGSEKVLDAVYSTLMIFFSALSLIYVFHRSYYGAINTHLDQVGRLWINITFTIVWVKIVIYKGYLSHQELCQRKELEGYWCPVVKRHYDCVPADDLHGMQKIWYYLNKGLLNSAVISCASEFFPVLLIAHWLACGGAEEKAEDLMRKRQLKLGLRELLHKFVKDISRVYGPESNAIGPVLKVTKLVIFSNIIFAFLAVCGMIARWFVFFYYSIKFDELATDKWSQNDWVFLTASILQAIFFMLIYVFAFQLSSERLDAHHKAQARGDIIILFGCAVVLSIKFVLQSVELYFQNQDDFITVTEVIVRIISLFLIQSCLWLQYLAIRRLLALSDRDLHATKGFLPFVAIGGFILAWIHFGCTFLDTSVIKYQLTDETFNFSQVTLICMIFTQTIFPADYLYAFTVSGCWMDLIIRYMELGIFQLGTPRLEIPEGHHHGVNHEDHERNSGNHDSSDKEHELVETETLSIESSDLTSSSNSIISKIADEKLS